MVKTHLAAALMTALGFLGRADGSCGGSKDPPKDAAQGVATSNSAAAKEVTLEGVDTSALTGTEKAAFSTYVSEFLSPCNDTPVPIAQCVTEKRACKKCLPAAKFIVLGIRRGFPKSKLEDAYKARFDADRLKTIPTEGSPSTGPAGAPVTMVEFADFECPHCGMVAPVLDKVVAQYSSQVRFFYKFMPLPSHEHAEPAAFAAFAAMKQGKFWEMHHKLYQNQLKLEMGDLENYATEMGLELGRFRVDMRSNEAREKISADKKAADDLKVQATPTVYINGREHQGPQDYYEWIATELEMLGIDPKAATTPMPTSQAPNGDAGKTVVAGTKAGSVKPAPSAAPTPSSSGMAPGKK